MDPVAPESRPLGLDAAMRRLADGDRSVFDEIFHALWPRVHAFCERNLGGAADADDAAQAALEKIFSEASRYDPKRPAMAWALAIAAWECRTIRKRATRRREDSLDVAPSASAPERGPDEELEIKRLGEDVRRVMAELSPADRETLVAAFHEEARERIEASGPTFRKRKQRALERFQAAWRKLYGH